MKNKEILKVVLATLAAVIIINIIADAAIYIVTH
jgi:hypothetical protein